MADVSDPRALRALAHPLRMRLLEAIGTRGESTATELSEIVNESPSNCSFHLRKLAQFGYIQRADDAAGREKPWRMVDPTQNITADKDDPAATAAQDAVQSVILDWEITRLKSAVGRPNPLDWYRSTFQHGATLYVTPDEGKDISRRITDIIAEYVPRITDPALRPEGGGLIRLFAASTYLPEYQDEMDAVTAKTHADHDADASASADLKGKN